MRWQQLCMKQIDHTVPTPVVPTMLSHYRFLPRDAMLARNAVDICLSVLPVGVLLKGLNAESHKQRHTITHGLQFSDAKDLCKTQTGSRPAGAPNEGG